ncbi:MAG: hypothetical protein ACJAU6_002613 [Alphaproteobacteria bacterium]|jgi:hypothetical protein
MVILGSRVDVQSWVCFCRFRGHGSEAITFGKTVHEAHTITEMNVDRHFLKLRSRPGGVKRRTDTRAYATYETGLGFDAP